jgi:hypothetical protein
MSTTTGNISSITGSPLTPSQQTDAALFGTPSALTDGETPEQQSDAVLLDLDGGASSSNLSTQLSAGTPPDLATASALVSDLATQIGQLGSQASSTYSLLSAASTLKLIQS